MFKRVLGAAAAVLTAGSVVAAGPAPATATPIGSLTAEGICPFNYNLQSWDYLSVNGTLAGYAPNTTYYLDIGNSPAKSTAKISNDYGQLAFNDQALATGPVPVAKTVAFAVYDKPASDPTRQLISRPTVTLQVNPVCNPWTATGGTQLAGDYQLFSADLHHQFGELARNGLYANDFGVLHRYSNAPATVLWHTGTSYPNSYIVLQRDGNLVVYDAAGAVHWQSRTAGNPGDLLVMQRDGNLVIYRGTDHHPLWQTGTAGR